MKYTDEISGSWESVLETLEILEPNTQHKIKLGQDIQFKASSVLITVNFQEDRTEGTIRYEFDNVKPI